MLREAHDTLDRAKAEDRDAERLLRRRRMQPKLKCPTEGCESYTSHVVRCRISQDGTVMRRRRQCDACARRFNTTERVEQSA